jgi:hypothetical protein
VTVRVIFPAERDLPVSEGYESVVGDGDAMGVASQVLENVFRSAEWWLDVDHPIVAVQLAKKAAAEESGFGKMLEIAMKLEPVVAEQVLETVNEFASKHAAEYFFRKQELVPGMNPPRVIRRQSAGGYDAVQVGMNPPASTVP